MRRTQIYLDDEIVKYLEYEKKKTRLSYSEIIRNHIKKSFKKKTTLMLTNMEQAAGAWKDLKTKPEEIISKLRKDRTI